MYVTPNFKTKKALKDALAAGKTVTVFQPNPMTAAAAEPPSGDVAVEGPHYPAPHTWYATVRCENGVAKRVLR